MLSLKNSLLQLNLPDSNVPKIGNDLLTGSNNRYGTFDGAGAAKEIFESGENRILTVHEENIASFV